MSSSGWGRVRRAGAGRPGVPERPAPGPGVRPTMPDG
ncbi:hypothetical protein STAFG_5746 [Streptomyces afghaniensis 772]|uniref:Uncharacterized protein n=1 Tax=Streptomyces afghaniensis 772 TaxID=1283301 RepID=S4NFE6_9ACTN|nr:hypothetical protein STAFG_5746 [Streptomyces afghaniensis 772]